MVKLREVNGPQIKNMSEMLHAIWRGDANKVRCMLAAGFDPKIPVEGFGSTILHEAALGGHLDIVKAALEHGMRVDYPDEHGSTALELAVDQSRTPVVRYLLEKGAPVTASSEDVLVLAVNKGIPDVVQLLVEYGAGSDGKLPIHDAARNGYTAIVKLLLDRKADVNAQLYDGRTPLDEAVSRNNVATIRLLLERGGLLNRVSFPSNLLDRAIANGDLDLAKLLVHAGAQFSSSLAQNVYRVQVDNDESLSINHLRELFIRKTKSLIDPNCHLRSAHPLGLIPSWLYTCLTRHKKCTMSETGLFRLPSRVIDVGPPDGSEEPFVYESTGHCDLYITLSHRWGNATSLRTTLKNIDEHRIRIPTEALSQIMIDAIAVTRYLNIRYLWIDSICIIQDSYSDWSTEAQNMAQVYRHSLLTIAASSSDDHSQGFVPRDTHQGSQHLNMGMRTPGPLDSRAWVLQEQLLSSRTISFSAGGLFWDCVSLAASTAHPSGIPIKYDVDFSQRDLRIFKEASQTGFLTSTNVSVAEQITTSWYRIVEAYSTREMTRATDKLIALKGIADEVGAILKDEYIVGLWRTSLWRNLLWFVDLSMLSSIERGNEIQEEARPRSSTFKAPTWSWASVTDPVSYKWSSEANKDYIYSVMRVLSIDIDSQDLFENRVSGRLILQGYLFVLCRPPFSPSPSVRAEETLNLSRREISWTEAPRPIYLEKKAEKPTLRYEWLPNTQLNLPASLTLYSLMVARSGRWCYCIALLPTSGVYLGKYKEYERVGILRWNADKMVTAIEPLGEQDICLV